MSRIAGLVLVAVLMALVAAFPAGAQVQEPPKTPTAEGTGGSAATHRSARHEGRDRRPASPAATPSTPRSPRPACSASSSRSRAGSAAAASWSSTTPSTAGSTPSTRARRRRAGWTRTPSRRELRSVPAQLPGGTRRRPQRRRARHRARAGRPRSSATARERLSSLLRPAERIASRGLPHRRDVQPAGHRQRRRLRRLHAQPRALPDARADRASRSAPSSATRTWRRPTSASARTRTTSTRAGSPATSRGRSSTRRWRRTRTARTRSTRAR